MCVAAGSAPFSTYGWWENDLMPADALPTITMTREAGTLRVLVQGTASLEATRAYWRAIADESARDRPRYLLLVDELQGEALGAADWRALVDMLSDSGLQAVRIAHVKPHGLDAVEHCELAARHHGFEARVFVDERAARLWLRYGERPRG